MIVRWSENDLHSVLTGTWDSVPAAQGFSFWKDGVRVSYTMDGTRTMARFGLDGKPHAFEVRALVAGGSCITKYPLPKLAVTVTGTPKQGQTLKAVIA